MPSREEIAERVRLVNAGYGGWVQPLDPSVTRIALTHSLFRDRFRAVKFREKVISWPGYIKTYTRAGADLDFYQWVNFIQGYNCAEPITKLYTLALPESNTVNLFVFKRDPSNHFLGSFDAVT